MYVSQNHMSKTLPKFLCSLTLLTWLVKCTSGLWWMTSRFHIMAINHRRCKYCTYSLTHHGWCTAGKVWYLSLPGFKMALVRNVVFVACLLWRWKYSHRVLEFQPGWTITMTTNSKPGWNICSSFNNTKVSIFILRLQLENVCLRSVFLWRGGGLSTL